MFNHSTALQFCSSDLPDVSYCVVYCICHVISESTILQSWNEHVSVQKAILPGLWSVMDSGGHGSAKVIYPCFLPLLSQLVDKVTKGVEMTLYCLNIHVAYTKTSTEVRPEYLCKASMCCR